MSEHMSQARRNARTLRKGPRPAAAPTVTIADYQEVLADLAATREMLLDAIARIEVGERVIEREAPVTIQAAEPIAPIDDGADLRARIEALQEELRRREGAGVLIDDRRNQLSGRIDEHAAILVGALAQPTPGDLAEVNNKRMLGVALSQEDLAIEAAQAEHRRREAQILSYARQPKRALLGAVQNLIAEMRLSVVRVWLRARGAVDRALALWQADRNWEVLTDGVFPAPPTHPDHDWYRKTWRAVGLKSPKTKDEALLIGELTHDLQRVEGIDPLPRLIRLADKVISESEPRAIGFLGPVGASVGFGLLPKIALAAAVGGVGWALWAQHRLGVVTSDLETLKASVAATEQTSIDHARRANEAIMRANALQADLRETEARWASQLQEYQDRQRQQERALRLAEQRAKRVIDATRGQPDTQPFDPDQWMRERREAGTAAALPDL